MSTTHSDVAKSNEVRDENRVSGAWLRLPCCNHSVHSVRILQNEDGVMKITAPGEPHAELVRRPDGNGLVTLGWTDDEGTTVLQCRVSSELHMRDVWSLEIVTSMDFSQRRKHRRVASNALAHLMDVRSEQVVPLRIIDMSEGGMRCSFTDFVPDDRGMPLRFVIRVDGTVLVLLANVRWVDRVNPVEVHIGFEFHSMHESLQTRLRAHVMHRLDNNGAVVF